MNTLLIATSNPGKLAEIRRFLADLPIAIVSLSDLKIPADAPETGKTFTENAIMKAKYYCRKSGLPTLADDGGFEIDALNGDPGVKSHRWIDGGRDSTDEELIDYALLRMKSLPRAQRGAQLHLVLAFVQLNGDIKTAESSIRGIVPENPSKHRTAGFPYRSLLFLPEINKFYDHSIMTEAETEKFNHRGKAIFMLKPYIIKALDIK